MQGCSKHEWFSYIDISEDSYVVICITWYIILDNYLPYLQSKVQEEYGVFVRC